MSVTDTTVTAAAVRNGPSRPWLTAAIVWALLLTVPFWLPMLGGYTALAGRVLVLGLAAMSFNLLLGFTGVMSFGHAAYFGLGAYGAGLTLKYRCRQHAAGHAGGRSAGRPGRHIVRPADRPPPRRLFRHGDRRVRSDRVLHRL